MESKREEFARLATAGEVNFRELCRRFEIGASTGYKWRDRFEAGEPLTDRSRRPATSPNRTPAEIEARVLEVRSEHPAWGGRKIRAALQAQGAEKVPSASTVTEILRRHGLLDGPGANEPRDWERFERGAPSELWQMDFKGHFATLCERCHPFDALDDHSRYCLTLSACANERGTTVKERLDETFRRYGLPQGLLCDNGGPWGSRDEYTELAVYLMRLGIRLLHGRPLHPQTQGKLERFHRTLELEALRGRNLSDLAECQRVFDAWRDVYNARRPHEALGMATPASRYRPSAISFPEVPPPVEYPAGYEVRKVQHGGFVSLDGRDFRVGSGLKGQLVGLRYLEDDGLVEARFVNTVVRTVDLRQNDDERDQTV